MAYLDEPSAHWLQIEAQTEPGLFKHTFDPKHVGNTFIRSIHGGVSGGISEVCAEAFVKQSLGDGSSCEISSTSMNYLRVTKDKDIYIRCIAVRVTRRLAFIDVYCWQDEESAPVTQGQCVLRLFRAESETGQNF